ncbi:MAG: hypothetical protein JW786_05455 [Desulfobacterales bacterium]|nr:hypothetical protein [Desulfobacterales bacterium]
MKRLTLISATIFALIVCLSLPALPDPPANKAYEVHKKQMEQKRKQIKKKRELQKEMRKHSEEMERGGRKHREEMGRGYPKRPDYHRHSGYRERPYQIHRHYGHYDYNGKRYDYHGHWRSWEEWDKYAKKYPHIYKQGRYYHEGAHLMFRFCDPGTGNCIFFSIGK